MKKYIPSCKQFINEGLIMSYPFTTHDGKPAAGKYLKSKFNTVIALIPYTKSPYWISDTAIYDKGESTYSIYLKDLSQLQDIVNFCDNTLGWFTIGVMVDYITNSDFFNPKFDIENPSFKLFVKHSETPDYIYVDKDSHGNRTVLTLSEFLDSPIRVRSYSLVVEAKFTKETKDFKNLFHVTTSTALLKIAKMGLVPKTTGTQTERVYFARNYNASLAMIQDKVGDNPYILALNPNYKKEWIEKYKFYEDPRDDKSVYTYDNIDPKYLCLDTGNGAFVPLSDLNISPVD